MTPLALYLASEACEASHGMYSASFGRYALALVVMAKGWLGPRDTPPSIEDISSHWARITDLEGGEPADSIEEEFRQIAGQLAAM